MAATTRNALILVLLSTLLQGIVLAAVWAPLSAADWLIFGALEMLLMVGLLANGGLIMASVSGDARRSNLAGWCFLGLVLCTLGDLVNRNFGGQYYAHGPLIEHSYLVDSVWFFLPGYAVLIYASWRAVRGHIQPKHAIAVTVGFAALGVASYVAMVPAGVGAYVLTLTGSYAVLITLCCASAVWLLMAFGRGAWPVALGFALATVADALIGQFWLFGDGNYPTIRYANWIIYFASQALVQQLPFTVKPTQ